MTRFSLSDDESPLDDKVKGVDTSEEQPGERRLRPSIHMDSMLKETRTYHTRLSMMADRKASMLITLCSLVITLLLPHMGEGRFQLPILILSGASLLTILFAAYTVMPKGSAVEQKSAREKEGLDFNPLFFGDFQIYDVDEYLERMYEICSSDEETYRMVFMDIYHQGKFIAENKYRILKYAYLSFVGGLCGSGAAVLTDIVRAWFF